MRIKRSFNSFPSIDVFILITFDDSHSLNNCWPNSFPFHSIGILLLLSHSQTPLTIEDVSVQANLRESSNVEKNMAMIDQKCDQSSISHILCSLAMLVVDLQSIVEDWRDWVDHWFHQNRCWCWNVGEGRQEVEWWSWSWRMSNTGRLDIDEDLVDVEMRVERRFVHSMFEYCLRIEFRSVFCTLCLAGEYHGVQDVVVLVLFRSVAVLGLVSFFDVTMMMRMMMMVMMMRRRNLTGLESEHWQKSWYWRFDDERVEKEKIRRWILSKWLIDWLELDATSLHNRIQDMLTCCCWLTCVWSWDEMLFRIQRSMRGIWSHFADSCDWCRLSLMRYWYCCLSSWNWSQRGYVWAVLMKLWLKHDGHIANRVNLRPS